MCTVHIHPENVLVMFIYRAMTTNSPPSPPPDPPFFFSLLTNTHTHKYTHASTHPHTVCKLLWLPHLSCTCCQRTIASRVLFSAKCTQGNWDQWASLLHSSVASYLVVISVLIRAPSNSQPIPPLLTPRNLHERLILCKWTAEVIECVSGFAQSSVVGNTWLCQNPSHLWSRFPF